MMSMVRCSPRASVPMAEIITIHTISSPAASSVQASGWPIT